MTRPNVNLFFASDDGYIPFLAVTLASLREHIDSSRHYDIKILNTGISRKNRERILTKFSSKNLEIEFCDVSAAVENISERLHTRDYYSKTTYYRLFIPRLFPDLKKALYLDCDIVLRSDVGELFDTDMGENLVAAASDGFVECTPRLHSYVTERVGVRYHGDYFNAGVLLMNLEKMREAGFEERFTELLGSIKFDVAQDQDYLNAICNRRSLKVSEVWNAMPGFYRLKEAPKLIHYNLDSKPWRKSGIEFEEYFWKYALSSGFMREIEEIKMRSASPEKSEKETRNLIEVAEEQGRDMIRNLKIRMMLKSILA